ncbi:hypothetical protein [Corallococcus exercitus]|uniref:hypothetical protein n=1 Tax=Corallococcus exercitus TaxID=2316736 RepID=UPI0035D4B7E7
MVLELLDGLTEEEAKAVERYCGNHKHPTLPWQSHPGPDPNALERHWCIVVPLFVANAVRTFQPGYDSLGGFLEVLLDMSDLQEWPP